MATLSPLNLILVIRIGLLVAVLWTHFSYFCWCVDLTSIPSALRLPSVDPQYCLRGKAHSHHLYYARNQFEPRLTSQRVLYNLGTEACDEVLNHSNVNNAYQTIGHKTVLVLRNENRRSVVIGKVHHKLNTRSEDNPEWATKIDRCLENILTNKEKQTTECSIENAVCEINELSSQCHCNNLATILSQPGSLSRYGIITGALYPALVFQKLLPSLRKERNDGEPIKPDSWPFAPYVGGCGIFAVSKYVGCPLSDFFHEDISIRIKIALKVLDAAIYLDEVAETRIGEYMLYNRDFHLENLALGTDGRVYITDTDEVSILGNKPDSLDENEWKCSPGMMQNVYDVLVNILSEKLPEKKNEGEIFEGFLNGLQSTKNALNLDVHPKTPPQSAWIDMAPIERVIHLNEVIASLNDTLYASSGCNAFLRWILTILCILVWLPKLSNYTVRWRWRSRTFRLPGSV